MTRILAATDGSDDARRANDDAAGLAKSLGAELIIASVICGVVEMLLQIIDERQVDAVVVGRHGTKGEASLLLGSIAHKLVSLSPRPVIVVP